MAFGTATVYVSARLSRTVVMPPISAEMTVQTSIGAFLSAQFASMKALVPVTTRTYLRRVGEQDPTTGRAPYRLVTVNRDGTPQIELPAASFDQPITWVLNGHGALSFSLSVEDPAVYEVVPIETEIQVWRGKTLIWWGVVVRARSSTTQVSFQAVTLEWYFTRRVIGKIPKDYLYDNRGFEDGERGWAFGFDPDSIPQRAPSHQIVSTPVLAGGKALRLGGSDATQITTTTETGTLSGDVHFAIDSSALTSAGVAAIDSFVSQIPNGASVTVVGHTDSVLSHSYNQALSENRANSVKTRMLQVNGTLNITAYGRGETQPIATNATSAGRALNRRATMTYTATTSTHLSATGHAQWAKRTASIVVPISDKKEKTITLVAWVYVETFDGPSKDGWAIRLERVGGPDPDAEPVYAFVGLNEQTPLNRWIRMECSVEVPADGLPYTLNAYFYPPNGVAVFDETSLTASDQLGFFDVDQALIVQTLVQHAQDPAMGKSSVNIGTDCPPTGVKRTREYPFSQRLLVSEALNEWPTLADGMDVEVAFTPTARVMRTYYPRKGSVSPVYLVLAGNVMTFDLDIDGDQTSTQVVVQAEGEGSDREEGVAFDRALLDGLVLERVYSSTPGSAVSSLQAQANRGLGRYHNPVRVPSVTCTPGAAEELLDRIHTGDIVSVDVRKGWMQEQGTYRVVEVSVDPRTDQVTFGLSPWDQWSV